MVVPLVSARVLRCSERMFSWSLRTLFARSLASINFDTLLINAQPLAGLRDTGTSSSSSSSMVSVLASALMRCSDDISHCCGGALRKPLVIFSRKPSIIHNKLGLVFT